MIFRVCLYLFVTLFFLNSTNFVYSAQSIPVDSIPNNIPGDVVNALKNLSSPDPQTRGFAALYLGTKGVEFPAIIPFLVDLLSDKSVYILKKDDKFSSKTPGGESVHALSLIGEKAIVHIKKRLADDDLTVRQNAAMALKEIGSPLIVEPFIELLRDEKNPDIRIIALNALRRFDDPLSIPLYLQVLENKNESIEMRNSAGEGLFNIAYKNEAAIALFISLSEENNPGLKKTAIDFLIKSKDASVVDPLISLLEKESDITTKEIISGGLDEIMSSIVTALGNKTDNRARLHSVEALKKIKNPLVVELYVSTLVLEKDPRIKEIITERLKKIRDPLITEPFTMLIDNKNEEITVRRNAAEWFAMMKDPDFGGILINAAKSGDQKLTLIAAAGLVKLDTDESIKALIQIFKNEKDATIKIKISEALKQKNKPELKSLFSDILTDHHEEKKIRYNAVEWFKNRNDAESINVLISMLGDEDEQIRKVAVEVLNNRNEPGVVNALKIALKKEKNSEIRNLLYQGLKASVNSLIVSLNISEDEEIRLNAATELVEMGHIDSIEPLVSAMEAEKSPKIRVKIAEGLKDVNNPPIKRLFLQLFNDPKEHVEVRRVAGQGLKEVKEKKVWQSFINGLTDGDPGIREISVRALSETELNRAIAPILELLANEQNSDVRAAITEYLSKSGDPEVVKPLIEILINKEEDIRARQNAAEGLRGKERDEVVNAYKSLLFDSDPLLREIAVEELVYFKNYPVEEALVAALKKEKDPGIRVKITSGLKHVRGTESLKPFIDILGHANENLPQDIASAIKRLFSPELHERVQASIYLGKRAVDYPTVIPYLEGLLEDNTICHILEGKEAKTTTVGRIAVKALADIGLPALTSLVSALETKNDGLIRQFAASAIGKIKDPDGSEHLISAFKSEKDPEVKVKIIEGLSSYPSERIRALLVDVLVKQNADPAIRYAAASVLKKIEPPSDLKPLFRIMWDRNTKIRRMVSEILMDSKSQTVVDPFLKRLQIELDDQVNINISIRLLSEESPFEQTDEGKSETSIPADQAEKKLLEIGAVCVESLVKAMNYSESSIRRKRAAITLSKIKDPVVIESLIQSLSSEKEEVVRLGIIQGLNTIEDPRVIKPLLQILSDLNEAPAIRRFAAEGLKEVRAPDVVEVFFDAIDDEDDELRYIAAGVLLENPEPRFIPVLIKALKNEKNNKNRIRLVKGFKDIQDNQVINPLMEILMNSDSGLQSNMIQKKQERDNETVETQNFVSLRKTDGVGAGSKPALPANAALLANATFNDEGILVYRYATKSLEGRSNLELITPFIKALKSQDLETRSSAASALVSLNNTEAVDPLIQAMKAEKDSSLRELISRGIKRIIAPLVEDLDLRDNVTKRLNAAKQLAKIRDPFIINILLDALALEANPDIRFNFVKGLLSTKDSRVVPLLADILNDKSEDKNIRLEIVNGFKSIDDPITFPAFITLFMEHDSDIKKAAIEGVIKLNDSRAIDPLVTLLQKETDTEIKFIVAEALMKYEDTGIIKPFIDLVMNKSEDLRLRRKVASSLKKIRTPELRIVFASLLFDQDPIIRRTAVENLEGMPGTDVIDPLIKAVEVENNKSIKLKIVEILGTLVLPKIKTPLITILNNELEDEKIREKAAQGLTALNDPELQKLFISYIDHEKLLFRGLAVAGLIKLATSDSIKILLSAFKKESDLSLKREIAKSLKASSEGDVISFFISALKDTNEDIEIREVAAETLINSLDTEVIKAFRMIYLEKNKTLRKIAAKKLEKAPTSDKSFKATALLPKSDSPEPKKSIAQKKSDEKKSDEKSKEEVEEAIDPKYADLPVEVQKGVKNLKSEKAEIRGEALTMLGEKGAMFPVIIPLIIEFLGNDDFIYWRKVGEEKKKTTPGKVALESLASIGLPAIPFLIDLLNSTTDPYTRQYCSMALAGINDPLIIDPILSALKTEKDVYVREKHLIALKVFKDSRIKNPLVEIVENLSEYLPVRQNAVEGLKNLNDPETVDTFLKVISDEDIMIRNLSADFFVENPNKKIVEPLIKTLEFEKEDEIEIKLTEALKRTNDIRTLETFIALLNDTKMSYDVRYNAGYALKSLKNKKALEKLIIALDDKNAEFRTIAIEALKELGDEKTVEPLIKILEDDEDTDVRAKAAEALALISDERAIAPLQAILENKNADVSLREKIVEALTLHKSPKTVPILNISITDEESDIQKLSIKGLVSKGDARAVDSMIAAQKNEKKRKIQTLLKEGVEKILDPLFKNLKSETLSSRIKAAEALTNVKDLVILNPILTALSQEKKPNVRVKLTEALIPLKDSQKVRPLLSILVNNQEPAVARINAGKGLIGLAGPEIIDPLLVLLNDKNRDLQKAVAEALAEINDPRAINAIIEIAKTEKEKKLKAKLIEKLGVLKNPLTKTYFLELVENKNEAYEVRLAAAHGLKELKDPLFFNTFLNLLQENKVQLRITAVEALCDLGQSFAVAPLLKLLTVEKLSKVKIAITDGLARFTDSRVIQPYVEILKNKNEHFKVRSNAANTLKDMKGEEIIDPFLFILNGDDSTLQKLAAKVLLPIKNPKVAEGFNLLLKNRDSSIRKIAIEAILNNMDSSSLKPLILVTKNENDPALKKIQKESIEKILSALRESLLTHKEKEQRIKTAFVLGESEDPVVTKILLDGLGEEKDPEVRIAMVKALAKIKDIQIMDPFIKTLANANENLEVRLAVAANLITLKNPATFKIFVITLEDKESDLRALAAEGLIILDNHDALNPFIQAIKKESDPNVRVKITEGLKKLKDPKIMQPLIEILNNKIEEPIARQNAAIGLTFMDDKILVEPFIAALFDDDKIIRKAVIEGLGRIKDKRSLEPLVTALRVEKDQTIRIKISEGLKNFSDPAIIPPFLSLFSSKDETLRIRQNSMLALKQFNKPELVEPFISALYDSDPTIRKAAAEGLINIKDSRMVAPFLELLKTEKNKKVLGKLTEGLNESKDSRILEPFTDMLNDEKEDIEVRRNCAIGLKNLKNPALEKFFISLLKNEDTPIRSIAAEALKDFETKESADALFTVLKDSDPTIQFYAVWGISKVKKISKIKVVKDILKSMNVPKDVNDAILFGLYSTSIEDKGMAAQYLKKQGQKYPSVIPFLISRLGEKRTFAWMIRGVKKTTTPGIIAADALTKIGKMAVWPLIEAISNKEENSTYRQNAAFALSGINTPEAIEPLILLMESEKNPDVRKSITSGFKSIKDERIIPLFLKLLNDRKEDIEVRYNAADGLMNYSDPIIIEPLITALRDNNPDLRAKASLALRKSKDPKTIPIFKEMLKDVNLTVQYNAVFALRQGHENETPQDYFFSLNIPLHLKNATRQLYSEQPLHRINAARYLAANSIGYPSVIPFLKDILGDDRAVTIQKSEEKIVTTPGKAAAEAMAIIGKSAIECLTVALMEGDTVTRQNASKALAGIDEKSITDTFISTLKKEADPLVRVNISERLKSVKDPEIKKLFYTIAIDPAEHYSVRYNAVDGLLKMRNLKIVKKSEEKKDDKKVEEKKPDKNVVPKNKEEKELKAENKPEDKKNGEDEKDKKVEEKEPDKNAAFKNKEEKELKTESKPENKKNIDKEKDKKVEEKEPDLNAILIKLLKEGDSILRSKAAEGLIGENDKEALEPLISALDDEYPDVRYNAALALKKIKTNKLNKISEKLIAILKDRDPSVRAGAGELIGAISLKKGEDALIIALNDIDPIVRKKAAEALGSLKSQKAPTPLLKLALNDLNQDVREQAALSFLSLADKKMLDSFIKDIGNEKSLTIQENAIFILGNMKPEPVIEKSRFQRETEKKLGLAKENRPESSNERLVFFSQSQDSSIRLKATEALVQTLNRDYNAVALMIKDPNPIVRRKTAKLMAQLSDVRIEKALQFALTDSDTEVRKNAAISLGKMGAGSSGPLIAALKEEPEGRVRKKILESLVKLKGSFILRVCIESLTDDDIIVRQAAAKALGESNDELAVFPLVEVLQNSALGIQKEAALALGNLKDVMGLGPLYAALESKNQNVREGAAEALKKITGKEFGANPESWKEAKKEMFLSDLKEIGKTFSIPLFTALAVIFIF